MFPAEWLGHQLGHLHREVRSTEKVNHRGSFDLQCDSPNMLLSGSRDKTLIIWNLTRDESQYGYPKRSLHGHSHIVSDCVRTKLQPDGGKNSSRVGTRNANETGRSSPPTALTLCLPLGTRP